MDLASTSNTNLQLVVKVSLLTLVHEKSIPALGNHFFKILEANIVTSEKVIQILHYIWLPVEEF